MMHVAKDSIDLGIICGDIHASLHFYHDLLGLPKVGVNLALRFRHWPAAIGGSRCRRTKPAGALSPVTPLPLHYAAGGLRRFSPGPAMADNIRAVTVRAVEDLENHDATRSR